MKLLSIRLLGKEENKSDRAICVVVTRNIFGIKKVRKLFADSTYLSNSTDWYDLSTGEHVPTKLNGRLNRRVIALQVEAKAFNIGESENNQDERIHRPAKTRTRPEPPPLLPTISNSYYSALNKLLEKRAMILEVDHNHQRAVLIDKTNGNSVAIHQPL